MTFAIPLTVFLAMTAQAHDGAAAAVAPFVDDEVALVGRLDLMRWDVKASARQLLGKPADDPDVSAGVEMIDGWATAFMKAGAKEVFVLVGLNDMPGYPVVVVPLAEGADGAAITRMLTQGGLGVPIRWPACETIHGAVVAGTPQALARIKEATPTPRPELAAALEAAKDAPLAIVLVPSEIHRKALEESIPELPAEVGGGPITVLTRGLRWGLLTLVLEPKPTLRGVVEAKDAQAAQVLEKTLATGLKTLAQRIGGQPGMADLVAALNQIKPMAAANQVTLEAELAKSAELVMVPIGQAREASRRAQCVNNLKQIALAMHNYHSAHNAFPPAFTTNREGKPLLSWRVLILPYLDQAKPLYDQFHRDEPWDSEHNKALISKMPEVFTCPSGSRSLAGEGKTCYLTPRGPHTVFPGAEGIKLQQVTDGTSNTIFIVDAGDPKAVVWTQPDDWEIAPHFNPQDLFGHHPNGMNVGFADGSVRFLKATIDPAVLHLLLTRDGGEIPDQNDF